MVTNPFEIGEIKINRRKAAAMYGDIRKSADAVNLVYVNDKDKGISRKHKSGSFVYYQDNKKVTDKDTLQRIKGLVLPPAWQDVWICINDNGHLQATGVDAKGRKQYKYHPLWNTVRNQTKFHHLYDFGKALPQLRQRLEHDLALKGLPLNKVLATVVSLMQCTCIRIGSSIYEKLYGSFGLSTLKDKHVKIEGSKMRFSFKGKKGVMHDISLNSRRLARIVQQCRDIPGKELFQYIDEKGDHKAIDSGMVNAYIKEISGGTFTAKDFRTWAGTLQAIEAFKELGEAENATATKKNIVAALDMVAAKLGNTRTVCKKYYVHPMIPDMYTDGTLQKYFTGHTDSCNTDPHLTEQEQALMRLLKDNGGIVVAA